MVAETTELGGNKYKGRVRAWGLQADRPDFKLYSHLSPAVQAVTSCWVSLSLPQSPHRHSGIYQRSVGFNELTRLKHLHQGLYAEVLTRLGTCQISNPWDLCSYPPCDVDYPFSNYLHAPLRASLPLAESCHPVL